MIRKSRLDLIFVLVALLIVGSNEYVFRNYKNTLLWKRHQLDQRAERIQTLVLGSSQAFHGIQPQLLGEDSFNAAFVSQDLKYDAAIFRRFQPRLCRLKRLVLTFSYFSPYMDLEKSPEDWRAFTYFQSYGILPRELKHWFDIRLFSSFFLRTKEGVGYGEILRGVRHLRDLTPDGLLDRSASVEGVDARGTQVYSPKIQEESQVRKSAISAIERHSEAITLGERDGLYDSNLRLTQSVVTQTLQQGADVTLVIMPVTDEYIQRERPDRSRKLREFLQAACSSQKKCHIIDFERHFSHRHELFDDADHLNARGAQELSHGLSKELQLENQNNHEATAR